SMLTHAWPFLITDDPVVTHDTLEMGLQGEIFIRYIESETVIDTWRGIGGEQLEIVSVDLTVWPWCIAIASDVLEVQATQVRIATELFEALPHQFIELFLRPDNTERF